MTDTTDIKALREGLIELLDHVDSYGGKCWLFPEDVRSIISSLDQLEAERQRAENWKASFENERIRADKLAAHIEALKGEQVPFGHIDPKATTGGMWVKIRAREGDQFTMPIFTAPQKPVLHPDTKRMDWLCAHAVEVRDPQMYGSHAMFHAQQDSEEWDLPHHTTLREQVDAAIKAAGGIVKDGE